MEHYWILCHLAFRARDESAISRRAGPRYALTATILRTFIHALHPVFSVPTRTHAAYQIKALPRNIKKYIFRMDVEPLPPLYKIDGNIGEKHYAPGGAGHA